MSLCHDGFMETIKQNTQTFKKSVNKYYGPGKDSSADSRLRRKKSLLATRREVDEWVDKAIKGDKKAFSLLYERYCGQVYAFCMRMLKGRNDVEDAVQQVFLEAWRSLYRFEKRSLFSTWLTKIAIHTCLSFHRKTGRVFLSTDEDQNICEEVTEIVWGQKTAAPDEHVWISARRKAIIKILNRLTKKKQTVFILSDMQGMTAPEIASILGIPDATVRTRLFHARREFASLINRSPIYRDLLTNNQECLRKSA